MRRVYRQRRDALLGALTERGFGTVGLPLDAPLAGFSLLLTLPAPLQEMEVVEEAVAQGVIVAPGRFFTPAAADTFENVRLTFDDKSPGQIEEAAHRLGLALHVLLQRGQRTYSSRRLTTDV